jgi:hypothetical protein
MQTRCAALGPRTLATPTSICEHHEDYSMGVKLALAKAVVYRRRHIRGAVGEGDRQRAQETL